MTDRLTWEKWPQWLVLVALFVAPILGGNVTVDAAPASAGLLSPETPYVAHFLILLPVAIASVALMWSRRVQIVPETKFLAALTLMMVLIVASIAVSRFTFISVGVAIEWLAAVLVLFTVLGALGKVQGPQLALAALAAGCATEALVAIVEYGQTRSIDPNWRVFGDWVHPNVLAGMLLLGFFASFGLAATTERLSRLLCLLGATVILIAIGLTQSKGGLLACGAGLIVWLALTWRSIRVSAPAMAVPIVLTVLFFTGLKATTPSGQALSRVTQAAANQEQSAGFRTLLWKSAVRNMQSQPAGTGIGTFRFESARAGLTQQTHFAHQSFLQLASEASPFAALALIGTLAFWLRATLTATRQDEHRTLLRSGVIAAVVASCAHSCVDSDLYHFGIAVAFFGLLGIGLQLAADGSTPELVPAPARRVIGIVSVVVLTLGLGVFALEQRGKADLLGAMMADPAQAKARYATPPLWAERDGEWWYLGVMTGLEPESAWLPNLQRAFRLQPSPKFGRALAREQARLGQNAGAVSTLQEALRSDPNNLLVLKQVLSIQESQGATQEAVATAQRMLQVEKSPYYQIRAIPEIVPTETADARLVLAKLDPRQRQRWLKEATDIYLRYLETTVPKILDAAKANPPQTFGGETVAEATRRMESAAGAAEQLGDAALAERFRSWNR